MLDVQDDRALSCIATRCLRADTSEMIFFSKQEVPTLTWCPGKRTILRRTMSIGNLHKVNSQLETESTYQELTQVRNYHITRNSELPS